MKAHLKKHVIETIKKRVLLLGYCLLLIYLGLNVALSQIISPVYFNLVENEPKYAVEFLTDIKPISDFSPKLEMYKSMYGNGVETAVFAEEERRNSLINKLERILKINPSSRDTSYNLFLLYRQRDDINNANVYFESAREIDPIIQRD